MKNILLPTDFSENSWNAIKYALNLYKNEVCNFYLLHVTLVPNYSTADTPIIPMTRTLSQTLLTQAKRDLQNLLNSIKNQFQNSKHSFFTLSSYNFFIDAVKDHIKEKKIDLVIMGTKGASGLSEVIMGSNTGDLINKVKCPTLVVPEKAEYKPPKEIAFPTDYNIFYQPKVLNDITELAKTFDSSIRILHIVNNKDETLTTSQIENKEFLNTFFMDEKHSFHRITNNDLEAGIQCFVESRDIDMIIMVAKNLSLFQRIFYTPIVEEISYHIKIPFLVLHE